MLNDNFSYTQLAFAFFPQKDSSYSHDGNYVFFFLLQKDFNICLGPFFIFFFLFQKEFDIFRMLLSKLLFLFFIIVSCHFWHIEKKNIFLNIFLYGEISIVK